MPVTQAEVGPIYDLLLATRDGSVLPCRNKDGKVVNVSRVAYTTSVDRNAQGQHEETELQHKDQLIQLGSSNLIDREFNQWPQVTQGDWSGGMLQRVFSGPNSDPSRYWDGDGILWPVSDYSLQQGALYPPVQDQNGAGMFIVSGTGTPAGGIESVGRAFAYMYVNSVGTPHTTLVIQQDLTRYSLTDPVDIATGIGTPGSPAPPHDFFFGNGVLWYMADNITGGLNIRFITIGSPTITLFDTIAASSGSGTNNCSVGAVGNKVYLAVPYFNNTTPTQRIRLYEIQNGVSTSSIDLSLSDTTTVLGSAGQATVTQTDFVGDSLIFAISQNIGLETFLISYSIPSQTFSVLAHFPHEPFLNFVPVAGSIFVYSSSGSMYLVQGGSIQHIGQIPQQVGTQPLTQFSLSAPVSYGPYAIFAGNGGGGGGTVPQTFIYAYDVIRGRLFRLASYASRAAISGLRIGLLATPLRNLDQIQTIPQWGVVVPGLSASVLGNQNAQEAYVGVQKNDLGATPVARGGLSTISSIIDFTSAQPKLYRQILATFSPLAADLRSVVTLDAWLDQDPGNLSTTPNFTTSLNGSASPGATTLTLNINQIATKLVYRISATGGNFTSGSLVASAPKIVSIIIRAATGWVQTLKLDLAPGAQVNSKNGSVWERQSSAGTTIDAVVAYSFLRQLWRLRGGQVVATLPNGDSGNWLIQDMAFDSPKPMAASFRADQSTQYQTLATVKLREDLD